MVSEPEGNDGFVGRALVGEGFNIREITVRDRVDSNKAAPAPDTGQARYNPLHYVKGDFRRRRIARIHTVKLWTVVLEFVDE